jgi:hypothetical protein
MGKKSDFKNCCVLPIDKSNCFVCSTQEHNRNKCPHVIKSKLFTEYFCDHPNVDGLPGKPSFTKIPQDDLTKRVPPSNK